MYQRFVDIFGHVQLLHTVYLLYCLYCCPIILTFLENSTLDLGLGIRIAFNTLKTTLTRAVALVLPDFTVYYDIETNEIDVPIDRVFTQ